MNPPIFLFGAPRSGTTILAHTLSAHPQVHLLHELRILEIAKVAGEMLLGTEHTSDPVQSVRAVLEGAPLAQALLAVRRAAAGAVWVGDKYPPYADQTKLLDKIFPGFRAIVIVRDGRDVASSVRSTCTSKRAWRRQAARPTVAEALGSWVTFTERALGAVERLGSRALVLRYEDVAADSEAAATRFEAFLGLPRSDELRAAMATIRPRRDWRHTLSPADQAVATAQPRAVALLERLGYPATPAADAPPADTPALCVERADRALGSGRRPEAIADLCRALDGPWTEPATRHAARRLAALTGEPESLYALAHLVERGALATTAEREAALGLLVARGLDVPTARAALGGAA